MIHRISKKKEHFYGFDNADEAAKHNVTVYKYWKDKSIEPGDYVELDSGQILKVAAAYPLPGRAGHKFVRTEFGIYRTNFSRPTKATKENTGRWWIQFKNFGTLLQHKHKLLVHAVFKVGNVAKAHKMVYGDRSTNHHFSGTRILKRKVVMEYAMSHLKETAKKLGYGEEWVIEQYAAIAKDSDVRADHRISAIDRIATVNDVKVIPGGQSMLIERTDTVHTSISHGEIESLKEEKELKISGSRPDVARALEPVKAQDVPYAEVIR